MKLAVSFKHETVVTVLFFFRFGIMGGKNSKQIQVQQTLDLTHFWVHRQSQPNAELNYRLVSLVSHIGPSSNCGHYTAIGLTSLGQFYLFDDSQVSHTFLDKINLYSLLKKAHQAG